MCSLGMESHVTDNCIEMSQVYIQRMLGRLRITECRTKLLPCDQSASKLKETDSCVLSDPKLFHEMFGSLPHVMIGTTPDLCFVVTFLSQHMAKPTEANLQMAKHVIRYLEGTFDNCWKFAKSDVRNQMIGYSDSDWDAAVHRLQEYHWSLFQDEP